MSRRLIDEVWNGGDFSAVDELIDPVFVAHHALPQEVRGPAGARAIIEAHRRGFPDLRMTVEDLFVHDDRVVTRWTMSGTHRGEWFGLAPTGRTVRTDGITIDRWSAGRAVESWTHADFVGVLQQLGVMPAPGSAGERLGKVLQRMAVQGRRLAQTAQARLRDRQS
jgi:steroid delta-isomerase-like uncharacterized protein